MTPMLGNPIASVEIVILTDHLMVTAQPKLVQASSSLSTGSCAVSLLSVKYIVLATFLLSKHYLNCSATNQLNVLLFETQMLTLSLL